jgi:hypothetical protein
MELGDYWQLFWELCISCPVRYLEEGPLRPAPIVASSEHDDRPKTLQLCRRALGIAEEIKRTLIDYDFTVKLDGTSIRKPILLPQKETDPVECRVFPVTFDDQVDGSQLKYRGYIYIQTRMIKPAEMRGILVRVRNVAIGDHDLALLNYPKVQGFRRDWLSGEVFVEQGLEDALNIDRHSFNEVHPHYLALQRHLHRILNEDVFPAALRASTVSGSRRNEDSRIAKETAFLRFIRKEHTFSK